MAASPSHRARLGAAEEEARRQLEVSTLLLEAAEALSGWTDLDVLLQALADIVLRALPHRRVLVGILAEGDSSVRIAAASGEETAPVGTALPVDAVSDALRHSYATGETVMIDYDAMPPDKRGLGGLFPMHFALIVPLLFEGRALGHFSVDDLEERREFTEYEQRIASGIASQAAVAIANARLLESERQAARFAAALAEASTTLGAAADPDEVLPGITSRIAEALGAKEVTLTLREPSGWIMKHHWGDHEMLMGRHFTDDDLPGHAGVLSSGKPHIVTETASPLNPELVDKLGYRAFVIQPLSFRGEVIGTLDFAFAESRVAFSETELGFMERLAYVISAAIETSRLLNERAQRIKLAEALNWINRQLHSTLEPPQIMERVVVETARALNVEAVAIQMRRGGDWEYAYWHGLPEALRKSSLTDDQARLSALAFESGEVVVANDPQRDPRANFEFVTETGVRAAMAVPLSTHGEAFAVLVILCFEHEHTFTELEADFARKVAATLSVSLENSRIYETQHHIADTLQQALLAMPERVPGIEFAHYYHAAAEAMLAGGDFFDIFELAGGRVGVLIGDVAGAGLDAAVLTSLVKNTIRAHAADKTKSPEQVLSLTNEVVYRATPTESFATVFLGVIDLATGTLLYSSAGHTTAALVREEGTVAGLRSTGTLLGALAETKFGQVEIQDLGTDQLLFLYTDGVTEARREHALYGEPRLFELLGRLKSVDPRGVADAVVQDVLSYSWGKLRDDLAILAVRLKPENGAGPAQQRLQV